MDADLLKRVMTLAERTGDRVIVVNPESGTAFAVLPFDAYEKMGSGDVGLRSLEPSEVESLSREALVDKINQDIATWNSAQQSEKEGVDAVGMDILDDAAQEEQYYLEPIE